MAVVSFIISAITFLAAITQLIRIEGPGSPDLSFTLNGTSGRNDFVVMLFLFAIAVVTGLVAMAYLYTRLKSTQPYLMLLALVLSLLASAMFMSLLTFHYTLVALVGEGLDTSSSQFHFFAVLAHAAGDFSGWISIGLWGLAIILVALTLALRSEWRTVRYASWVFSIILVVLYCLGASYSFLILFATWEILVAIHLFWSRRLVA